MPNRARIASAIFASLLAGASLTTITRGAAEADEECLSAPKGPPPPPPPSPYRMDRTSKRQCWYLRDEGEKAAAVAAPKQAQPAAPPPPVAGQFAAADLSPAHSVQMLLAAIMGALALAGVMGRLIFNFVGTRRRAKRTVRGRRGAIWKSAATGRKAST